MSAYMHTPVSGHLVLVDRNDGAIASFASVADAFAHFLARLPLDARFSEFQAVFQSDRRFLNNRQLEHFIESCQQELDKRALVTLKGPTQ